MGGIGGHGGASAHQACTGAGSALPSATRRAIRRLPSSTASRISAEFLVESWRISVTISSERSWKVITESTSFLTARSEEHTSELQSRQYLVCRLLLEKKKSEEEKTSLIA